MLAPCHHVYREQQYTGTWYTLQQPQMVATTLVPVQTAVGIIGVFLIVFRNVFRLRVKTEQIRSVERGYLVPVCNKCTRVESTQRTSGSSSSNNRGHRPAIKMALRHAWHGKS